MSKKITYTDETLTFGKELKNLLPDFDQINYAELPVKVTLDVTPSEAALLERIQTTALSRNESVLSHLLHSYQQHHPSSP